MHGISLRTVLLLAALPIVAQELPHNGLSNDLSNLYRVSNAKSFSISPENLTGAKGKGGMAAKGVAANEARE